MTPPSALLDLSGADLARRFAQGHPLQAQDLAGFEYRGVSLGLPAFVERLSWKTFVKAFPLWTMKVWPTKSGMIVQERDQVFSGSRFPRPLIFFTSLSTFGSTNGPFFRLRLKSSPPSNHFLRRRMMKRDDGLRGLRVLPPFASTPVGEHG